MTKLTLPTRNDELFKFFKDVSFGLSPLFDQLNQLSVEQRSYPPYDILAKELLPMDAGPEAPDYQITLAVAGFGEQDLKITVQENQLTIVGQKEVATSETLYYHKGIAARNFERKFVLGQYLEVENVSLKDGLLTIDIRKNIPEEAKPKLLEINSKDKLPEEKRAKKSTTFVGDDYPVLKKSKLT